jgi:phosphoenolpyruvate carboxylase
MDDLSALAFTHYRALVKRPHLIKYFHEATPIDHISALNIGSRPARRKATQDISDLRAIPWVFAWTQSRVNLPSWYGVGSAIAQWLAAGDRAARLAQLQEMYTTWPFFRTVIDNVQMGLAKADITIASLYAQLTDAATRDLIYADLAAEFDRSVRAVLEIAQAPDLLEKEPVLRRSIKVRNPYVDPLNYIQVALLQRLAAVEDGATAQQLRAAVLLSVNGIAAGLQNTG